MAGPADRNMIRWSWIKQSTNNNGKQKDHKKEKRDENNILGTA